MEASGTRTLSKSVGSSAAASGSLERFFLSVIGTLPCGALTLIFPSGNSYRLAGADPEVMGERLHATLRIRSSRAIRRIVRHRDIGFAEAYMHGEWDSPDLGELLRLLVANMDILEARFGGWRLVRAWNRMQHFLRANTRAGSRRNIAYHYDLGNDFYRLWLDPGMTYSAALFDETRNDDDLVAAQDRKYETMARALDLRPGHRVLEIGCGWGGFAEYAARRYGCRVVCLTLSQEQLEWARRRIDAAGLSGQVECRFQDYRDVRGQFDRIVSIEMFEAVGEEHWPTYFEQVARCLVPGGRAGLQVITIAGDRYDAYRATPDFIQKYVFPGGMLPSEEILAAHFEAAGLALARQLNFGLSYAQTLAIWREQFLRQREQVSALGYSARFRRMWEYYLAYCEAGFRHGTIDVGQYFLTRAADATMVSR